MSINSASLIAYSALMATQVQMTVSSANISNADTKGYTEKTANQESLVSGGAGAGVNVASITGDVDKLLMKSLVGATSDLGSANSLNNYLDQLQSLYGSTGDSNSAGNSLGNTLASLESAVSALANSSDVSSEASAVQALNSVALQLRQTSSSIQQLRSGADQDISSSIDGANKNLQLIGSLNDQITQAAATGQPIGDLEDQRSTAIQAVASNIDISYFTAANGSVQVYTASGQALVDGSVHALSYTPATSATPATVYSSTPPSGFGGIMVNGVDITRQINSGAIGALVDLRDQILPAAQSQLDQLASQLTTSLNAVHNQGTSLPPPASLTGSAAVTASTSLSATGTVRLAETDQQGNLVKYQDLDLSGIATVGDLVNAINSGASGLSASINANGNVVISAADSGDGVAVNEMTSSVGANKQGLSDYLGLNDLVTGSSASDIAVRGDILSNPGLLAISTLDSSASPSAGSQVVSAGSTAVANNLYSALTDPTTFPAIGGLGSTSTSFADYAANVVANVASKSSQASIDFTNKQAAQSAFSSTMSSESGVNLDEETARLSSLQNEYSAAAELLQVINQMFTSLITAVQSTAA
jgi:flagellar hook-associated protein 1 FlgK